MKKEITDHLGRVVSYNFPPKRIVTLCPGITETLFALDLEDEIVGRTRFCIFPKDKVDAVPAVAGTKDINLQAIHDVQPDLIIVEKEENTKEIVDTLAQFYPVFVAEVQTVDEAYRMIEDIGSLTNRDQQAVMLVNKIKKRFDTFPSTSAKRVAYVIWRKPYMVVGKDTYIQSVLSKLGFVNPFVEFEGRYPAITEDDLRNANLDYVFLASEPYPYKDKHKTEFQAIMPNVVPLVVDGEMFWYGAKMIEAVDYFKSMFEDF